MRRYRRESFRQCEAFGSPAALAPPSLVKEALGPRLCAPLFRRVCPCRCLYSCLCWAVSRRLALRAAHSIPFKPANAGQLPDVSCYCRLAGDGLVKPGTPGLRSRFVRRHLATGPMLWYPARGVDGALRAPARNFLAPARSSDAGAGTISGRQSRSPAGWRLPLEHPSPRRRPIRRIRACRPRRRRPRNTWVPL
jgi:hypothetical protein